MIAVKNIVYISILLTGLLKLSAFAPPGTTELKEANTAFFGITTMSDTIIDVIPLGVQKMYCVDTSMLEGQLNFVTIVGAPASPPYVQFELLDTFPDCYKFAYKGINPGGTDSAYVVVCDNFNICDTLPLIITVVETPKEDTTYVKLRDNQRFLLCLQGDELAGDIDTILEFEDFSGSFYEYNNIPFCYEYYPKGGAQLDIGRIGFCDEWGICDYTTYIIEFCGPVDTQWIYDTVLVNFAGEVCLDTTELPEKFFQVSGGFVDTPPNSFTLDIDPENVCVSFEAINLGTDTVQITIYDRLGNEDIALLSLTSIPPAPSSFTDTLTMGDTSYYCIDDSELAGPLSSFFNDCLPTSNNLEYSDDIQSLCIEAIAESVGTDQACYILCDQLGICDTFYFALSVIYRESDLIIDAIIDLDTTLQNEPINVRVLNNDITSIVGYNQFFLLSPGKGGIGPNNGEVTLNSASTGIIYTPDEAFCGDVDAFSYVICNDYYCDTASVYIYVDCILEPIEVFDGFSPNGDGVNDYFTINGLEFFNTHHLIIYNRWGNPVYESKNYQNDWNGTWRGEGLPDGTYFYLLEVDGSKSYSGYIVLQR